MEPSRPILYQEEPSKGDGTYQMASGHLQLAGKGLWSEGADRGGARARYLQWPPEGSQGACPAGANPPGKCG